ncbi:hypothetical protein [Microlunatus speluncae]|uniref:hypothetical protein n=1 Tax=Microlunatus speluncae TaxID=2594267 RepID=UPI0012660992|nr:hypothetical protein [Microlunatus speluncae]
MAETRRMSPMALSMRKRSLLVWGIVLLVVWAAITIPVTVLYSSDPIQRAGMAIALQLFIGILGLLGVIFLIVGIAGEVRSKRFNKRDWALADALHESLGELWHEPAESAYRLVEGDATISGARLVEIERHFDSQTEGAINGTMSHQLRMFGTSFSSSYGSARSTGRGTASMSSVSAGVFSGSIKGLSEVNLNVSTTTRNNLMGDALFAVFEAPGPAGVRDTYRVISMSQPGVISWLQELIGFAANQVGGPRTHAGGTVLSWVQNLISRFAPGDISYVTDRLKALHSRSSEEREPVTVYGTQAGRNALIATSISIGGAQQLSMMPSRFPALFGRALAIGVANGEQKLAGQPIVRPSLSQA